MGAGSGFSCQGSAMSSSEMVFLNPVISYTNTPPGAPATGDRYLINTAPTGVWVGKENQVAQWNGAIWVYTVPVADDFIFVTDSLLTYRFNGITWLVSPSTPILQNGNMFGSPGVIIGTNDVAPTTIKYNNTPIAKWDFVAGQPTSFLYNDLSHYLKTDVSAAGQVTFTAIGTGAASMYFHNDTGEFIMQGGGGRSLWFTNGYELWLSAIIGGAAQIKFKTTGFIELPTTPTGAASVSVGELFFDTAANILAGTDLILAKKV